MSNIIEVHVPDIGDFDEVEVIEVWSKREMILPRKIH